MNRIGELAIGGLMIAAQPQLRNSLLPIAGRLWSMAAQASSSAQP